MLELLFYLSFLSLSLPPTCLQLPVSLRLTALPSTTEESEAPGTKTRPLKVSIDSMSRRLDAGHSPASAVALENEDKTNGCSETNQLFCRVKEKQTTPDDDDDEDDDNAISWER